MKTIIVLAVFLCLASTPYLRNEMNGSNVRLSFTEKENHAEILAKFPKRRTTEIQKLVLQELSPKEAMTLKIEESYKFNKAYEINGALVKMESSAGRLKLEMEETGKLESSRLRIKRIFEEVKQTLAH
jgi:hypothetical protein